MNTKTVEQLQKELQETIDKGKEQASLLNNILTHLKPFEGKRITKRIVTHLQAQIPGYVFHLEKKDFLEYYELTFWGGKTPYTSRFSIPLAPRKETVFHIEHVQVSHYWFFDTEQIRRLERAILLLPEWVSRRDSINKLQKDLKEEMRQFDCHYLFDRDS